MHIERGQRDLDHLCAPGGQVVQHLDCGFRYLWLVTLPCQLLDDAYLQSFHTCVQTGREVG